MAIKAVTATRMTMLKIKDQLKVALRGHKLLKDKQDGLMQAFLKVIREAKALRSKTEAEIKAINIFLLEAQSILPKSFLETVFAVPVQKLNLEVNTKTVMSVKIPIFKVETTKNKNTFGAHQTRLELSLVIKRLGELLETLIALAEIEKSAENLAIELEKNRRRVNALEYTLVPDLQDTLRFIKMKLGEAERSSVVQVMAIKAMIEEQEALAEEQEAKARTQVFSKK